MNRCNAVLGVLALGAAQFAFLVAPASAQMFKCVGTNGKATYIDRPCDIGAKQTNVEGRMTGRVPAILYYEIYSKDWAAMRREIDQKGPKGFHGLANWKVNYNYHYDKLPGGQCAITSMVPRFEGDILLPHWVPGPGVGAEQLRQWERFSAALKVHEEGHVEHGIQLSNALAQLSGMQAPSCGEVESKLKQRADDLIRSYSNVDVEYDRTTNHGATQGAVLNY